MRIVGSWGMTHGFFNRWSGVAVVALLFANPVKAQIPDHPVITEVYTDPNGVDDGPFCRDPANPHQEYIEIYLPPLASLSPTFNKDALRLTFYEVEGDATSGGVGLVNYRFDLPTFDLDPSNGTTAGAVARPSSGVVVLGWVNYTTTTPVVLAGTPSTRLAMINGGITTTGGSYTFVAMNGAHGTGTANFPVPLAENLIDMPSEACSGVIQNGSGVYLLVNRDALSGYVMLCDDQHPSDCPNGADPKLPDDTLGAGLNTPAHLDGFASQDDVVAGDLQAILTPGGAFTPLIPQVLEFDALSPYAGTANGYARSFVDVRKTTEDGAVADNPLVDAEAYRHIRNDGPFFPTPGRAVLTTTAAELGVALGEEFPLEVLAQTTAQSRVVTANVGGDFSINITTSPGPSSNPSAVTFAAGQAAMAVQGQSLAFPTIAVTGASGAADGAMASSTITITATNSVGGQPPVVAPIQVKSLTATVLNPTTGSDASGNPFQTTVFAAVQGIPASGISNEFRTTSLGTFVANNLGGAVQDAKAHGATLINPATNFADGPLMQGLVGDGLDYPDPGFFINLPGPVGRLNLRDTVVQSAEVLSGATTYFDGIDGLGVRARRVNIPDTLAFGGSFTPTEPLHFADATGLVGATPSGLTGVTTTRTFELAILDTNVRHNGSIETGDNDDVGIIIEVAATEPGAPVVTGEFVFLSFMGGLQGASLDGVPVPPNNSIATVIYLDTDNLHSVLGIRSIEAIFLLDAGDPGSSGELDPVEVFSLNPIGPTALIAASPATTGSLWRSSANIARLTFNQDITLPGAGQVTIQQMLPSGQFGANLSSGFGFAVENDGGGNPRVLKIVDAAGSDLLHRQWYAIRNTGAWSGVANFTVQYVVQIGDTDNDRQVLNLDTGLINAAIPDFSPADDDRRDIDGDGAILSADVSSANSRIPSLRVNKPSGH